MATSSSSAPSLNIAAALGLNLRPLLLLLGIAAAVAVGVTVVLWWQGPDWSLLYGNLSDSDSASVVQALQSAGIRYKLDDNSGAILVPVGQVRNARLRLASEGLPAGSSSFEALTKDQGFGVSQFMENARYQYAVENELARTIALLQPVRAARVHLALPPQSPFVSQQQSPSASVLVELRPGRQLDPGQVSAIVHLVASSIPQLDANHVTVVDQDGRLLSAPRSGEAAIDAAQFEAEQRIEHSYARRIEQLIAPMVGVGRVRAEVTVKLSGTASEQASEHYQPKSAVVRSEQESQQTTRGGAGSGGVPGSLTNQPPAGGVAVAAAPGTARGSRTSASASGSGGVANRSASGSTGRATAGGPVSSSSQSTKNFEIDRTVSYSNQPAGQIQRVTVAVLVDDLQKTGAHGKLTEQPLAAAQIADITALVKNAVGFDAKRGDSVNVVNVPFLEPHQNLTPPRTPLWQQPWLRQVARLLAGALVLAALVLGVLRPLITNLARHAIAPAPVVAAPEGQGAEEPRLGVPAGGAPLAYEQQVVQARNLVSQDPKRVAQVVKTWVGDGS